MVLSSCSSSRSIDLHLPPAPSAIAAALARVKNKRWRLKPVSQPSSSSQRRTVPVSPDLLPMEQCKEGIFRHRSQLEEKYTRELVQETRWDINEVTYWKLEASLYFSILRQQRPEEPHWFRSIIPHQQYWESELIHYRYHAPTHLRMRKRARKLRALANRGEQTPVMQLVDMTPSELAYHDITFESSASEGPISSRLRNSRKKNRRQR